MISYFLLISCVTWQVSTASESTKSLENENVSLKYISSTEEEGVGNRDEKSVSLQFLNTSSPKGVEPIERIVNTVYALLTGFQGKFPPPRDALELPKIDREILGGRFVATGGYFRSMASLMNAGKMELMKGNLKFYPLIVPLTFQVFEAGYRTYTLDLVNMSHTSSLKVTAGRNRLDMTLRLVYSREVCFLDGVEDIDFRDVSGIDVTVDTLDENYRDIMTVVMEWLAENLGSQFQNKLIESINENLQSLFPQYCDIVDTVNDV